jgi:serine/threonine-protein kinase
VRPGNTTTNAVTLTQLALQNLEKYDEELKKELEVSQSLPKPEPIIEAPVQLSGMEGQVINGLYRIDKLMGQGGMGQIFLASHMAREEMPVVLKLLIKKADKDSVEYNRFLQEMLISGRLRHPNLIKVFDYGILLDGLKPYLVMEYVEGVALRQVLRKSGSLPIQDAARIITQACDGLHEVHQKGVVHRDLKPENLMVKGDYDAIDNVKILDFGIAQLQYQQKFDEEGLAVGSVGYMSPEQICAQPVDHRTDIYSLGLIFYEAITGHPPFVGSSRRETMAMHVQNKHMPPSAMASIPMGQAADVIVDRALAKHPDHRYQSVKQMQSDLYRLLNELGSARA